MALTSPGLEVQVIDESTYLPSAQATVPLILLATASNKLYNRTVTSGTIDANAGKLDTVSSTRELITKYGTPGFQTSSIGTQLHGDERNEYGLMAAYSALQLGNRAYIIRANVDLDDLVPTTSRPSGRPADGLHWLDTSASSWGIFEWNLATNSFSKKTPVLIYDNDLSGGVPKVSVGAVGSYGVVLSTATTVITTYYKGISYTPDISTPVATWVELGSIGWQNIVPTLTASVSNPVLTINNAITINTRTYTFTSASVNTLKDQINNDGQLVGVSARVVNGKLVLYANENARSDGVVSDGKIAISNTLGAPLTALGIAPGTYNCPRLQMSSNAMQPEWNSFDSMPRPTGSVWFKTSETGDGLNVVLKQYNADSNTYAPIATPVYANEPEALFKFDAANGGSSIAVGTIYGAYDVNNLGIVNMQLFRRRTSGVVSLTSKVFVTDTPFATGQTFTVNISYNSEYNLVSYTVKLTNNTLAGFVSDVIALNIPNLSCTLENNRIIFTHLKEGMINLTDVVGNAISTAEFSSDTSDFAVPLPSGLTANSYSIAGSDLVHTGFTGSTASAQELVVNDAGGNKTLQIQSGLGVSYFSNGQYVHVYQSGKPTTYIKGTIVSYNNITGVLEFDVNEFAIGAPLPPNVNDPINAIWIVTTKPTNYSVGSAPPTSPAAGDRWLDSRSGIEYIWSLRDEGTPGDLAGPWVAVNNVNNYFSGAGQPVDPQLDDKWYNTTNQRLYTYRDNKWIEIWSKGLRTTGTTVTGFEGLTYTFSSTAPAADPEDGTLWYYSSAADVDIMINTSTGWKGYRQGGTDARGYNLSMTDPNGVIASASQPVYQSDGTTTVKHGDIWLNTSDLRNYPALYRYNGNTWDLIDNSDQVSSNGILFADARWGTTGNIDPISGELPPIGGNTGLVNSNYLDLDAPDYRLYPRGMLMFNTRRSGFNVKRFKKNYFNNVSFKNVGANNLGLPASLPTEKDCWVTASGLKLDGSMFAGPQAQRNIIVGALKAAIDSNVSVREDQYEFNLICCPGYPELIPNMVALNNERANTAFVIGDTPMKLVPNANDLIRWSNNADGNGLGANNEYLGVFYPSGLTNDLEGDEIAVPASHMILRTILRSDNVSFPWFAPAGARRGIIDNANSIGYIDPLTNEFVRFGVGKSVRDTLYENKINPLTVLPGTGVLNYGQKTRYALTSALDRINVARLISYIRKALQPLANNFLFEPNDTTTRDQIKNAVEGLLNDLVAKRALYDYIVVCDDSNNTPDRIARNELYVDIAIAPVRTVEFIYIPLRVRNPGNL